MPVEALAPAPGPPKAEPPAAESLAEMIAPARTALAVIDIQGDFAAPDGAMGQVGCDLSEVEGVIDRAERLIAAARRAGAQVMFARVVTTAEGDAENLKAFYRRKGYPEDAVGVCRAGTPGADYYRVRPEPGDIEVAKPLFSSFVATDLEAQLRARGVDTLAILGLTTDCCVDCTARDAFHRGFHVFLVEDACSAYDPALHRGSVAALSKNVALTVSTAEVLEAWGA